MKKNLINLAKGFGWGILICLILSLCTSCKTKYVTVPEVHKEYIYKTDTLLHRDSTFVRDSVFLYINGDTVFKEKWHTAYVDKYRYINKTDTVLRTDSIPVVTYIEKDNSSLHKFVYNFGLMSMISLVFIAIGIYLKRRFN